MNASELKTAAIRAHRAGESFGVFWPSVVEDVRVIEPYSQQKFRRLHDELLMLTLAGATDGRFAVGDDDSRCPWEVDDATQQVDDTNTRAKAPLELLPQTCMFSTATPYWSAHSTTLTGAGRRCCCKLNTG